MATAVPIRFVKADGLGFPTVSHDPENDGETFQVGVPVTIDSSGHIAGVSDPITETIVGVSVAAGSNLTTAGTGETTSVGTPIGQANASVIPVGAPLNDGTVGYYHADGKTVFRAALVDGQTFTQTLVDATTRYALTVQANGYFAIDSTDTGTDADHAAIIEGVDPNNNEFVDFRFAAAVRKFD